MRPEQELADFVCETGYGDLPADGLEIVREVVLTNLGTIMGGARTPECQVVAQMATSMGGVPEASLLVWGGKAPAQQAAFVNAVMARSLDFDDSMAPGAHPGAAVVPAALAAAELVGGVNGKDFLAAVAVGIEVAIRMNLAEGQYDGFDPTGVCVPFGSTAAVAKLLGLSSDETRNALGLAFCRCGGSFQANVDGALAVRMIQGWVSETGVLCSRLAREGITGPANFLAGVYGYFHLFGRDRMTADDLLSGLGSEYRFDRLVFKKYPSCGGTLSSTELILNLMAEEHLAADEVERVEVKVTPYIYRLVGHPFQPGGNPKVSAQFSIRYCVANALVRGSSKLAHFEVEAISDPRVLELVNKVEVMPEPALDARHHSAAEMRVITRKGREYLRTTDLAPGFPGNPLSQEDHRARYWDCVDFAASAGVDVSRAADILEAVSRLEDMADVRELIRLLTPA